MNGRGGKLQPNLSEEDHEKQKKQEEYKEELVKVKKLPKKNCSKTFNNS